MSTQVSPVLNTNRLVLAVPSGSAESAIFEIHSDARTYEHRPDLTMKHARKPQHCAMNGSTNGRKTASDTSLFLARTRKARTPATSSASVEFANRWNKEKTYSTSTTVSHRSPRAKALPRKQRQRISSGAARNALICRLSQSSTRPILPQFGLQKSWDSRSMLAPECPETMTYTGFSPLPMSHLWITWAFG